MRDAATPSVNCVRCCIVSQHGLHVQVIRPALLKEGFTAVEKDNLMVTDDVSIIEAIHKPVKMTQGSYTNIKVCHTEPCFAPSVTTFFSLIPNCFLGQCRSPHQTTCPLQSGSSPSKSHNHELESSRFFATLNWYASVSGMSFTLFHLGAEN